METNMAILGDLEKTLVDNFVEQLKQLPPIEYTSTMVVAAFRDGCRAGIQHTVDMLGVTVRGRKEA
jgi:hypothetical protein